MHKLKLWQSLHDSFFHVTEICESPEYFKELALFSSYKNAKLFIITKANEMNIPFEDKFNQKGE